MSPRAAKPDPRRFMDPQLRRDVRFLTSLLGQIIQEQEGAGFFQTVEQIRTLAKSSRDSRGAGMEKLRKVIDKLPYPAALKVARAFTIYFQLVNLAEESQRVRRIHWYKSQPGPGLEMSLTWTAHQLKSAGVGARSVAKALQEAEVSPVLTAHPTEVRRRTTTDHLADIGRALDAWNQAEHAADVRRQAERAIRETLEILWHSNEARQRKLTVADEVSQTLFFIERTILGLIPELYDELEQMPGQLGAAEDGRIPSFLHFGSWVGADRDGNPHVTPEVTWNTAKTHQEIVVRFYRGKIEDMIRRFSQADTLLPISKGLRESLEKDSAELNEAARALERYEASEPYRKKLSFMHTRLLRLSARQKGGYASAAELIADLQLMKDSLAEHGSRYAARELNELIRQVETFGFFLARLEFREHRDRVLGAVSEVLSRTGREGAPPYESLSEADRVSVLRQVLMAAKGKLTELKGLSPVAADLMAQFKTMGRIQKELDPRLAGTYLLSMTRAPSDILAVLALGAWAGLVRGIQGRKPAQASFDVVPLFETITDLARSQEMMVSLWTDPVYRRYLAARGHRQQVMLGYSDANKDGGYLAANWALYQAQAKLARAADEHGVKLVLFHGKGGTIDRGGGLSHRAILAQPFAAPGGRIKITEQGEVVAAKYSNPTIACRNIEQLISAVVLANLVPDGARVPAESLQRWETIMEELAEISERAYRALVFGDPDFLKYYGLATPIQILLEAPVAGTRPGARPQAQSAEQPARHWSVTQLRAIPWVFSWVQSRHMLSAWYGLGSAVETFRRRHGAAGLKELTDMAKNWAFARVLWENAQASLGKTDLTIAQAYASLVEPPEVREKIFKKIEAEYKRAARGVLAVTGRRTLLEDQPVLKHSIILRNPYVDPLNVLQVRGLQELRGAGGEKKHSPEEQAQWLELIRLTIHGVAYGMKSTG